MTARAEHAPRDEAELEDRLSLPPASLAAVLSTVPGDVLILGAGGKMGPSLARMLKRTDPARRVVAAARWTNPPAAEYLRGHGVETERADLLDLRSVAALPDAANIIYMAGQKFGTSDRPERTWAFNAGIPAFVGERYAGRRLVVFSSGNVYPLTSFTAGGSREEDPLGPVGEYAYSCLARERLFASAAARHESPTAFVRLNYAHDLRYGVLTDLAVHIVRREPIDLRMSYVNVIWQGDANARALAALAHASAPEPFVVNVAGPETLRVADVARALGERLGVEPQFNRDEREDALLSNASRMSTLLDDALLPADTLLDWVADWVQRGGRLLGKPTGFERRDGKF